MTISFLPIRHLEMWFWDKLWPLRGHPTLYHHSEKSSRSCLPQMPFIWWKILFSCRKLVFWEHLRAWSMKKWCFLYHMLACKSIGTPICVVHPAHKVRSWVVVDHNMHLWSELSPWAMSLIIIIMKIVWFAEVGGGGSTSQPSGPSLYWR